MRAALSHVSAWVFDLDNTLYPADSSVFPAIDVRMTEYVAEFLDLPHDDARSIQKTYYARHGTTLKGLMQEHGMAPEDFLHYVHEVDLSPLTPCNRLRAAISALPGRKYVYTNGSRRHAERVTRHMGLDHLFDGMSGIEDCHYHPKPDPRAYYRFCDLHALEPSQSIFFEDLSRNLVPAHAMGFTTVLVRSDVDWSHEPEIARPARRGDDLGAHVHYVTEDLAGFLLEAAPETQDTPP